MLVYSHFLGVFYPSTQRPYSLHGDRHWTAKPELMPTSVTHGTGTDPSIPSSLCGGNPVFLHRVNTAGRAGSPSQGQGRIRPPAQALSPAQPVGCRGTLRCRREPLSRLDHSQDGPQGQRVQPGGLRAASPVRYHLQREQLRSSLPLQSLRWK